MYTSLVLRTIEAPYQGYLTTVVQLAVSTVVAVHQTLLMCNQHSSYAK